MKKLFIAIAAIVLFGCNDKKTISTPTGVDTTTNAISEKEEIPQVLLIIPAQRVGLTEINQDAALLDSILGVPDLSDAAMGKAWLTWYGKTADVNSGKYELNIFTTYKDSQMMSKVVRQIRVTSPDFKIASNGLSTGRSKSDFEKQYPDLKRVATYKNKENNIETELYEVENGGIAFEFEAGFCYSIIVFERDQDVARYFRTFHPEMQFSNRE